jgi:hypothetical protein
MLVRFKFVLIVPSWDIRDLSAFVKAKGYVSQLEERLPSTCAVQML